MTKSRIAKYNAGPQPLDRHAIVVVRINPRQWELRSRKDGELFATIHSMMGGGGKVYSYRLVSHGDPKEMRVHKGFSSLKSCVARVLQKV